MLLIAEFLSLQLVLLAAMFVAAVLADRRERMAAPAAAWVDDLHHAAAVPLALYRHG